MHSIILSCLITFGVACAPSSSMASPLVPTKAQSAHIDAMLTSAPLLSGASMDGARSLIARTIATSACATSEASFNDLNDVMISPRKWGNISNNEVYAGQDFHAHNKGECLDIAWIRTRSYFGHQVIVNVRYAAGEDRRYVHQSFYFKKMSDGRWLISAIDAVFEGWL